MFLFLLSGSCGILNNRTVSEITQECLSNGLIIFNQDGIYYIPTDSCCFLLDDDKDMDGLILENRVRSDIHRCYEQCDLENLKAVKYHCEYAPDVWRRTIPGVNDDTYFIKKNTCYVVFAQIRMLSYRTIDYRIEHIYTWDVSIVGQKIRVNIIDGRSVFFDIERTEPIDSVQLVDFLKRYR